VNRDSRQCGKGGINLGNAESDAVICDASSVSGLALRDLNPPLRAASVCNHAVAETRKGTVVSEEHAGVASVADGPLGVRLAFRIDRNQAIRGPVEDPIR
jgi:hypothetical protein